MTSAVAVAGERVEMGPNPASQLRYVQLRIVGGHLLATTGEVRGSAFNHPAPDRQEKLTIGADGNLVTVHYELKTPTVDLRYDIERGRAVRVKYAAQATEETTSARELEFTQQSDGPTQLRLVMKDRVVERSGPTLWHVLLSLSAEQRVEALWLIELIRPQWRLGEKVAALDQNLLRTAYTPPPVSHQQLATWIKQLGSKRFSERQAAERSLRAAGQSILPLLREAERGRLDAEQRYRLRAILHGTSDDEVEDTVERTTALLAVDPYLWFALLERNELDVRQAASERLSKLLGAAIEFDPTAEDQVRARQLERLAESVKRSLSLRDAAN